MAERALVLDANILIRAVLGQRARQLIQRYAASIDFVAPDTAFVEAEENIPALCAKVGLELDAVRAVYTAVSKLVQELPVAAYREREVQARARIERRDADDWPVIASALLLECPIWTEDNDFFGAGVSTWTSDRVELYLAEK